MSEKCDHFQQLMLDALTVPLSPKKRSDVQRHVKGCIACREFEEGLEADDRLLSDFTEAMRPAIAGVEISVMEALQRQESAPCSRRPPLFGGRRMRLVAAAAIVCGVLVLVGSLLLPLSTSTVTLAETLEAMKHVAWIHVVQTRSPDNTDAYEYWECFEARTQARKAPSGKITYANYAENVMYSYNPNANKITVSFTTDSYMVGPQWNPVERLADAIEQTEEAEVRVTRSTAVENGTRIERIRVDRDTDPLGRSVVYTRDVERNLLLQQETTVRKDGQATVYTTTFNYPGVGPADIYALGAPQDAAVLDIRPEGPALALVDQVQERFERGFGDHLAVVLESWVDQDGTRGPSGITVLRQQDNRKRADIYHAFDFQGRPAAPATLYGLIKDAWPDLTIQQVLEIVDANALDRRMLFDGEKTIQWRRDGEQLVRDEHGSDEFKILEASLAYSLTSLIWPNLHLRLQSGSSQLKREVRLLPEDPNRFDLVGLQFVGFAEREDYWFDPGKDDMQIKRVKKQEGRGVVSRFLVAQPAQTPDGRWYPKVLEMESSSSNSADPTMASHREWRVLLDANPTFDDGIFTLARPAGQEAAEPNALMASPETEPVEPNDTRAEAVEPVTGLTGWVRDERGLPIADATVALYHNRNHWGLGNRVVERVQTNPNGRFLFDVPPTVELTTQRASLQDSYVLLATHLDRALGWQHIRQGQERETYEITLTEPVSRTITVTDHNDLPLPGARVWLGNAGDRKSSNPLFRDDLRLPTDVGLIGATADSEGRAVIGNLPATPCCFNATLAGYADGWAFSSQDHIRLSPGATVSGWVVTETGGPVGTAVVRLYTQWSMHLYFLAETDGEGHFELRDLPARGWDMSPFGRSDGGSGHYKLTVEHEDYAGLPQELHLSPGETIDDLVIEMATETTLVRCLVLEEGTDIPVAGARIDGTNKIGSIEGESDANGVFTVRVLPGPVRLSFRSPPDGVYILDNSGVEGRSIRFNAEGREMDVTIKSPVIAGPLVTASGTVYSPDGLPLEGAVVYADAGRFRTATTSNYVPPSGTDANGRFTLKGVPAGLDLRVYAETRDHALASMAVYPAPADANELISMELVLLPTEAAIALIEHEEDHPASSLTLTIVPMVEGAKIWRAERTDRTDETGLLQIDGIVPGLTYFLRDARFDRVGPRPKDRSEWFQGKEMMLIPLEP
jgi:hypothetical protein